MENLQNILNLSFCQILQGRIEKSCRSSKKQISFTILISFCQNYKKSDNRVYAHLEAHIKFLVYSFTIYGACLVPSFKHLALQILYYLVPIFILFWQIFEVTLVAGEL